MDYSLDSMEIGKSRSRKRTSAAFGGSKNTRLTKPRTGGGGGENNNDGCILELEEGLLFELLIRLPIRSVFRFKCVSKQWLSLISDPSFQSSFYSRPKSSPPPYSFIFLRAPVYDSNPPRTPFYQLLWSCFSPPLQALASTKSSLYIRATDKGFLLLGRKTPLEPPGRFCFNYSSEFYICSPMNKQCFTLPPHNFHANVTVALITQIEGGRLSSFKVVIFNCPPFKSRPFLEIQVFSSETGRWVDFRLESDRPILLPYFRKPVILNTTVYLMEFEIRGSILAYDPYQSPASFRLIELPSGSIQANQSILKGPGYSNCGVSKGHLRYFEISRDPTRLNVWQYQQIQQDWCLMHSSTSKEMIIDPDDSSKMVSFEYAEVLSLHPFDPDVVYIDGGCITGLFLFNLRTRRAKRVENYCIPKNCFFVLLQHWPISIPIRSSWIMSDCQVD